jgi:MFS transporter, DHA3 family, macrolide efflux protein
MQTFLFIWIGQIISLLGSKLTEFSLGVWVYQQTESLTQFSLVVLCMYLPNLVISPLAGILIDRWDRRWAMILSDLVAGASTLVVIGLLWSNSLQIWHIYLVVAIVSCADAFGRPAYAAAIGQIVPQENLSRANGMVQMSGAIAKIFAPFIAGFLIDIIALKGILLIDFSTFAVASIVLLFVRLPVLTTPAIETIKLKQLWQETTYIWNYIVAQPGLLSLLSYIATTYFVMGTLEVIFWPFVLNFASSADLGRVISIGGCGMLLGSLGISIWGGPKRRIYGIFSCIPLQGLALIVGGLNESLYFAALVIFLYLFAQPIVISCNRAIWQSKIPLNLQGRVFAWQNLVERSLSIIAYLTTGLLVEHLFEPLMAADGLLANSIGRIVGVGTGRGIGLLLFLMGFMLVLVTLVALQQPRLRQIEAELLQEEDASLELTQARSAI